jgi:hypothetical protein
MSCLLLLPARRRWIPRPLSSLSLLPPPLIGETGDWGKTKTPMGLVARTARVHPLHSFQNAAVWSAMRKAGAAPGVNAKTGGVACGFAMQVRAHRGAAQGQRRDFPMQSPLQGSRETARLVDLPGFAAVPLRAHERGAAHTTRLKK